jgi:hypothetical protein
MYVFRLEKGLQNSQVVASPLGRTQLADSRSPPASLPPSCPPVCPAPPLKLARSLILQIASLLVFVWVHYHKTTSKPSCVYTYRDENVCRVLQKLDPPAFAALTDGQQWWPGDAVRGWEIISLHYHQIKQIFPYRSPSISSQALMLFSCNREGPGSARYCQSRLKFSSVSPGNFRGISLK